MKKTPHPHTSRAFSLVELSIVLAIIALLIGGVMAGQSMVKAAELRSVMTDANNYITAVSNFRAQYRGLPGDILNATSYWSSTTPGDGDGLVGPGTTVATRFELFEFWRQLNLAGFVDKAYTGVVGGGGANDFVIGSNIPSSRIAKSGFSAYYSYVSSSGSPFYQMNYGNMLTFGGNVGTNSGQPITANLTPPDAFTLDTKADDGLPGTGKWIANGTGGGAFGTATSCTTSANNSDFVGTYRTTLATDVCSFFIITGF
jgi:prepilin-type N-terminal cleavage/methylation domain-containing protein